MPDDEPKWRRRKDARPSEIVDAALEVFAEKGFAAAKLDDIARRAGVSKATLYLYFDTKKEIFRAVARAAVASLLEPHPRILDQDPREPNLPRHTLGHGFRLTRRWSKRDSNRRSPSRKLA